MLPEWIVKILEGMGVAGAIIFVLLTTTLVLVAYVKSLQAKADKVYGYRLQERDTLNKTLSESSKVLEGIIKANEDRNDIMQDQADLILKQSHAFELLKTSVLAQYDNIKDHNATNAMVVSSMAEAIRHLSSMVIENRTIAATHVLDVKKSIGDMSSDVSKAITAASQAQLVEMRSLLGNVTTIHRRRKITK